MLCAGEAQGGALAGSTHGSGLISRSNVVMKEKSVGAVGGGGRSSFVVVVVVGDDEEGGTLFGHHPRLSSFPFPE